MQHSSNTKRPKAISGDEQDTFSRYWRRILAGWDRAGKAAGIKRSYRRRERHLAAERLRKGDDE